MLMVILLVLHQVTEHTFFFSSSVILGSSCIFCQRYVHPTHLYFIAQCFVTTYSRIVTVLAQNYDCNLVSNQQYMWAKRACICWRSESTKQ